MCSVAICWVSFKKCGLFKEYFGSCFCSVIKSLWLWTAAHQALLSSTLSPRLCSNSCPLSQWCYLIISASAAPFSFCLHSFPASEYFPLNQFFASDCQSIGASASTIVLLTNIQGWFLLGLTVLISLQSIGLSRVFSSTTIQKHQFFGIQPSLWSNSHISAWLLEKTVLTIWTFVSKVMSLLFNMLSRFAMGASLIA